MNAMSEQDDFWGLRPCLAPPIREFAVAADLLDDAADALLAGDEAGAHVALRLADLPAIFVHAQRIMGRIDPDIHRLRPVPPRNDSVRITARMPPAAVTRAVFARDGWRCRFCACRVVPREVRDRLRRLLPGAIPWSKEAGYHAAFYAITATLDHVLAHAAGGTNDLDNLVTACWPCNFGRGAYSLAEFGLSDPRTRDPIIDDWDGLTRILHLKPAQPAPASNANVAGTTHPPQQSEPDSMTKPRSKPRPDVQPFLAGIDARYPGAIGQFLAFIETRGDLGLSTSFRKVLVVQMRANGELVTLMGIEPDGSVAIPWQIGPHKRLFARFCEILAGGISGAVARESRKVWIVSKPDKSYVSIAELQAAQPELRQALEALHAGLMQQA